MTPEPVAAPILDDSGLRIGTLVVTRLPGRTADRLELVANRVRVDEGATYVFHITGWNEGQTLDVDPGEELFSFDDATHSRGRLRPRQHVGRIRLNVRGGGREGRAVLSVEPRKLEAETEYRRMLDDIADVATEAILHGFAPAAVALEHALTPPQLLYQQFAFLHARLIGAGERDLAMVLHRPHHAWIDHEERRLPGMPLRGGSRAIRALTRPGPRIRSSSGHPLATLPTRVTAIRSEETLDTEPNRFIALRWSAGEG